MRLAFFNRATVVAIVLLSRGTAVSGDVTSAPLAVAVSPRDAIARIVAQRLGREGAVVVESVETRVIGTPRLEAVPEPSARTGTAARFLLSVDGRRLGMAVAVVRVHASHVRATRAIARGEAITEQMVETRRDEIGTVALTRLPEVRDVVGLTARRPIANGESVTAAAVAVPSQVRTGEPVEVTVTIGRVRVSGSGVASGSGNTGDVVHVLQRGRPRALRARVTGPGAVEVIQ